MLKFIRVTVVGLWFFGGSAILLPYMALRPFRLQNALLWCRIVPPIARRILGYDFEVRSPERMIENHPSVIIANHQHALDLVIFPDILRVPTTSIGKKELKWIPFFGWVYWLSAQILIDRKHKQRAMGVMEFAKNEIQRTNATIWVFPEGTRSKDGVLGQFKKGAFYLAIQTQRPILPIVANTFSGYLNFNKWKPGKVVLQMLEPISTKGLTIDDMDSLIEKSRRVIVEGIAKIDRELSGKTKVGYLSNS